MSVGFLVFGRRSSEHCANYMQENIVAQVLLTSARYGSISMSGWRDLNVILNKSTIPEADNLYCTVLFSIPFVKILPIEKYISCSCTFLYNHLLKNPIHDHTLLTLAKVQLGDNIEQCMHTQIVSSFVKCSQQHYLHLQKMGCEMHSEWTLADVNIYVVIYWKHIHSLE